MSCLSDSPVPAMADLTGDDGYRYHFAIRLMVQASLCLSQLLDCTTRHKQDYIPNGSSKSLSQSIA